MSTINAIAIFHEFSFLSRYIDRKEIEDAYVKRFDEKTLDIYTSDFDGSSILLLTKGGNVVTRVRCFQTGPLKDFLFIFQPWTWWYTKNESVIDAVKRIKSRAQNVFYVVVKEGPALTVFKPPKGFKNIGDWLSTQVEQNRKRLSEE